MARTNALNITTDGTAKDQLAESYGHVIEAIRKQAISEKIKNTLYSGDPSTGSIEIDRFANATAAEYGTARAGGKGNALKNSGKVTVNLDVDREIVEEIEDKDIALFGLPNIVAQRGANHADQMVVDLDKAFFATAEEAASAITTTETSIEDQVEALIQSVESTENDFVNGVDRNLIVLTCTPNAYGKLRNHIDKVSLPTADAGEEEVAMFHGVRIYSNVRQTSALVCMIEGAVAQPVHVNPYKVESINLSSATAVELFYYYGTKAIMPDLIKKLETLTASA